MDAKANSTIDELTSLSAFDEDVENFLDKLKHVLLHCFVITFDFFLLTKVKNLMMYLKSLFKQNKHK